MPLEVTRIFKPGTTTTAQYIKHDPLWYAAKWGGFSDIVQSGNKAGIPDDGEWNTEKSNVPDNYFLVTNAGKLKEQLAKAFQSILSKRGSASVIAVEAGQGYGAGYLYQAKYNSENWTGQVLAIKPTTMATGTLVTTTLWDAGEELDKIAPNERTIITRHPTNGFIGFEWDKLDLLQQQALSPKTTVAGVDVYDFDVGKKRLDFLRGDTSNEGDGVGQFRKRNATATDSSVLGDIVNSSPLYVSYPPFRYRDDLETSAYSAFRKANADRAGMVYVGANDGMLHGFSAADGKEKIAYVPSTAYKGLAQLTLPSYNTTTSDTGNAGSTGSTQHRYFVDSTPTMGDAFWGGSWHTVLIGRLGAGGQGTFALDITKPADGFSTSNVLWERTDADTDYADLGYTYGKAVIAKMNNGQWAAIFGNGYNNLEPDGHVGNGQGVLYVVNVETGEVIQKINTGVTSNGLSTPWLYDVDGNDIADWIYIGDVEGRVWKFDVSDSSPTNWEAKLLFTATDQPITTSLWTLEHPKGGVMVLFGTGRFLGNSDKFNTDPQAYYGIWDRESIDLGDDLKLGTSDDVVKAAFAPVTGNLMEQKFSTLPVAGSDGKSYRMSSANEICWYDEGGQKCKFVCQLPSCNTESGAVAKDEEYELTAKYLGWYIKLPYVPAANSQEGSERVYSDSELSNGRIIFTSNAPTTTTTTPEPCESVVGDGKHWLNILDALTGKRLSKAFVNVDSEGKVTAVEAIDPATGKPTTSLTSQSGDGLSYGNPVIPPSTKDLPSPDVLYILGEKETGAILGVQRSWRQLHRFE